MKLSIKRGEKGFTLVELMVVMAIMAVLSAIVIPSVSGTKQISLDTQVEQDAKSLETAIGTFNAESSITEEIAYVTADVMGTSTNQSISSRWPEVAITELYNIEFPATAGTVGSVTITDEDGIVLYGTGQGTGYELVDFIYTHRALDVDTLVLDGYIGKPPKGFYRTHSATKPYHEYLWVSKVGDVAYGDLEDGGRSLEVYALVQILETTSDALTYEQIY